MQSQRVNPEDGNTPEGAGIGLSTKFKWSRLVSLPSSEESMMDQTLPAHQFNAILGRNPAYPFDAELKKGQPCYALNEEFFACLNKDKHDGWHIHERLASCNTEKIALMKCQTKARKEQKLNK